MKNNEKAARLSMLPGLVGREWALWVWQYGELECVESVSGLTPVWAQMVGEQDVQTCPFAPAHE